MWVHTLGDVGAYVSAMSEHTCVVSAWRPRDVRVAPATRVEPVWCPCGVRVAPVWRPCGVRVATVSCPRGY